MGAKPFLLNTWESGGEIKFLTPFPPTRYKTTCLFFITQVLMLLRRKIDRYLYEQKRNKEQAKQQPQPGAPTGRQGAVGNYGHISDRPEADQNMRCKY